MLTFAYKLLALTHFRKANWTHYLSYYTVIPFLYLFSLLPLKVLYAISSFVSFIIYRILKYRVYVVRTNLQLAFPHYSEGQRKKIEQDFYVHFCDLLVETIKALTISHKQVLKRCTLSEDAMAVFKRLEKEQQSFLIVMGHLGNWEWGGGAVALRFNIDTCVIYHPLEHPLFDRLFYRIRARMGGIPVPMQSVFKEMVKRKNKLTTTAFLADQNPPKEGAIWTDFLHQHTAVFRGPEVLSHKLNRPVLYLSIKKIKRGYYQIESGEDFLIYPQNYTETGSIIAQYSQWLTQSIIAQPECWIWSHKRWKATHKY